ncbi:MAG: nucleotidyltransferase family protein [Nitrospirota bacterium]
MAAVKTKKDVSSILISHREEIEKFGVSRLGLFGSFAREKQKKTSDIDLLVEFRKGKKNFRNFMHLAFYLEELLHRKVELVTPESLSPYLKPSIIRNAEYVFE